MSDASEAREQLVADTINKMRIPNLKAKKANDVKLSDVQVTFKSKTAWVEVKMNHTDNLGNVRIMWDGQSWKTSDRGNITPLKKFMEDLLNTGAGKAQADQFLSRVAKFVGESGKKNILLPTTKSLLKEENAVSLNQMRNFFRSQNSQYVIKVDNIDLGKLVTQHYNEGKGAPVNYLQASDDFYLLGKGDPLDLQKLHRSTPIPLVKGKGTFKMRIGLRTDFYEIQPEIKIATLQKSPYSLLNTKGDKINPFAGLK